VEGCRRQQLSPGQAAADHRRRGGSNGYRTRAWKAELATILHDCPRLPQVAIAALFSIRPETINKRIHDIRQLLD
jgi:hypothetical protein